MLRAVAVIFVLLNIHHGTLIVGAVEEQTTKQPATQKPVPVAEEPRGLQEKQLKVSDDLIFTVFYSTHDSDKLTFSEAEEYCSKMGKQLNKTLNEYAKTKGEEVVSHLVSVHTPFINARLMSWVIEVAKQRFWIGGNITRIKYDGHQHFYLRWSDHSPDDFRFLHLPDKTLLNMESYDINCLAVNYLSGRWSAFPCSTRMNFVCTTVVLDKKNVLRADEMLHDDAVRQGPPQIRHFH